MKIRGNYILMFVIQFLSGILTYFACVKYDIRGVIIGFVPFLIAMILVQVKYTPDERELSLLHKSNSYEGIIVAVIMVLTYMHLPNANWFYIFAASIGVVRGAVGAILFLFS